MWICLDDCFLSIVSKDCRRDHLLVRARRKGDIEKLFPRAKVARVTVSDYLYRAAVPREEIARALDGEVRRICYGNFKDSVKDERLHNAYMRVWTAMSTVQDPPPYSYSGARPSMADFDDLDDLDDGEHAHGHPYMLPGFGGDDRPAPKKKRAAKLKRGR